jgi:hypothetical protein
MVSKAMHDVLTDKLVRSIVVVFVFLEVGDRYILCALTQSHELLDVGRRAAQKLFHPDGRILKNRIENFVTIYIDRI